MVNGKDIPFTNITDKGYRLQLAAWQHGHQSVLLPDFKKSDEKFSDKQTISSATIAKDRSSNERAVRLAKKAGFLNIAMEGSADWRRIDDAWLAWSFQTNFMYKTVC